MQPSFRLKVFLIVGSAMLTLLTVIVVSAISGLRQSNDLTNVESRMVPRLLLAPQLEADFDRLARLLQDAVAAQDSAALEETVHARSRLFELIGSAGSALEPHDAASVRWKIQDYYDKALNVSRRLIAGETGENLVADIARMQEMQKDTVAVIRKATGFNHDELNAAFAAIHAANDSANRFRSGIGVAGLVLGLALSLWVSRSMLGGLSHLSQGFARFAVGDFAHEIPATTDDELGRVAKEANQMAASLKRLSEHRDKSDWIRDGQVGLSDQLRGELDPSAVATRALWFLARRMNALVGALYVKDEDGVLRLAAQYGMPEQGKSDAQKTLPAARPTFAHGEGLVGQAAETDSITTIDDVPAGYMTVQSGLGEAAPRSIVLLPLTRLGGTTGIVELALFKPCSEEARELLESVRQMLATTLDAARSQAALRDLLARTQEQATRLTAQEEELRLNNQELQVQQEELRKANEELEAQRQALSEKNGELDEARARVQQKADELEKVSSYKSQFLSNMSHELRTPLNSMLLLSHLLAENETGNLTARQVEHSKTIHGAGQDLLALINQVLDLSKIEAGKQEVDLQSVPLTQFAEHARRVFSPLATNKGLRLVVEIDEGLPKAIVTDRLRVERILINLLGNAIKFTDEGEVALRIRRPETNAWQRDDLALATTIAFAVTDSGIGIPLDAQERVFAPFEQADGRSDRRYAGTGLGLAIARESATLLGGELRLVSAPGKGSTFTCYLPETLDEPDAADQARRTPRSSTIFAPVEDDRAAVAHDEPHLLIVEDDPVLAESILEIIHARKLKAIVAATGEEALQLAQRKPLGILLDVKLPDIDGWEVMERLKRLAATQSIPVHFVSGVDAPERGLSMGAVGYLTKPASRSELASAIRTLAPPAFSKSERILVVEDSPTEGATIVEVLLHEGLEARHVQSAGAALAALTSDAYGCLILDLGLPDMDGLGLLETLAAKPDLTMPRVVVHTGRALTRKETRQLELYAEAVILKDGTSDARLLEEIRLFVRHVTESLPLAKQPQMIDGPHTDASLDGTTILLAEDDMRTVYAISALLRGKGAEVLVADSGREALDLLAGHPDVDGVLMDIMMPEMDGYEAMRQLRKDARFAKLPVIALTAKAMKGERERCLEAGASDYLTKPVDSHRLLVTLQSWLGKQDSNGARNGH